MARRILVGTDRGAFIYERDHTGEWQLGNQLLAGWRVDSITTLPGGRILAGTGHDVYGTTVRRSDDGGETWTQVDHSPSFESGPLPVLSDGTVRKLDAIWTITPGGPAQPGVTYAGTTSRLFSGATMVANPVMNWLDCSTTRHASIGRRALVACACTPSCLTRPIPHACGWGCPRSASSRQPMAAQPGRHATTGSRKWRPASRNRKSPGACTGSWPCVPTKSPDGCIGCRVTRQRGTLPHGFTTPATPRIPLAPAGVRHTA